MEGLNDGHKKNVKHLDFFKALKQLRGLCDVNVAWDKCVRFVVRCLFCGTLVLNWRIALVCWNFCWDFPIYNNSSFELKDCGFGELGVFFVCVFYLYITIMVLSYESSLLFDTKLQSWVISSWVNFHMTR